MGTVSLKQFYFIFTRFKNKLFSLSDDDCADASQKRNEGSSSSLQGPPVGANPFLDIPQNIATVEYKKGYVMRKCCYDSNNKKSKLGVNF